MSLNLKVTHFHSNIRLEVVEPQTDTLRKTIPDLDSQGIKWRVSYIGCGTKVSRYADSSQHARYTLPSQPWDREKNKSKGAFIGRTGFYNCVKKDEIKQCYLIPGDCQKRKIIKDGTETNVANSLVQDLRNFVLVLGCCIHYVRCSNLRLHYQYISIPRKVAIATDYAVH